ncbi:GNAT family N-acetyltransferase [Thalassotalea sp. PS06]|uniref:GNAT family N-acetyltransferase n=1 Tax=Thalassotalea sp. PS06 TaxID=2594005 RepID=UPI0011639D7A|nr:GNAT family N-acetyltransferase [Thalassotalea sp. PS06]QDP02406.1 GNAT family N-acetyltransferase [Thalassotalea sp. PS06]
MPMQVQLATANDAKALSTLMEKSFRDTFSEFNAPDDMDAYCLKNYSEEKQCSEILNSDIVTKLVFVDDVLAGFTQVRPGNSFDSCPLKQPLHLDRIYVGKDFLGTGVGKILFEDALQQAKDLECDGVWLGVWEDNPRAIRFYQKFGFIECGTTSFWLGSDEQRDILMVKEFS